MDIFRRIAGELYFTGDIKNCILKGYTPAAVTGVSAVHKAQLALGLSGLGRGLIICGDEAAAIRMMGDINEMAGSPIACHYPAKELSFAFMEGISREYEHKRIEALSLITSGKRTVMTASIEALIQGAVPPGVLGEHSFSLESGDTVELGELTDRLVAAGYVRCEAVEGQAQFAVRGSIIDIFPVQEQRPVRIELWGDDVDSMAYFDTESQRRTETIGRIDICPALEILFPDRETFISRLEKLSRGVRGKLTDKIREHIDRDMDAVRAGLTLTNLDKYYKLAYEETASVLDYFTEGFVMVSEYTVCLEKGRAVLTQLAEDLKLLYTDGVMLRKLDGGYFTLPELESRITGMRSVFLDTFMRQNNNIRFKKLINADCRQTSAWGGSLISLEEELRALRDGGYCTIVLAGSEKTAPILVKDLTDEGFDAMALTDDSPIVPGRVYVRPGSLSAGFDYPDIRCALITQQRSLRSGKRKAKHKTGDEIRSLADIHSGDLVVHSMYGIGRFRGIQSIDSGGVKKDYITISYAGTDVLYVPVTQLDLVSRYVGPGDEGAVKLNKLNSTEWNRTRSRVRKAVRDMAEELTKLYAQRQMAKGFAFSPDSDWQLDFEERFDYQETDDQLRSIREIKQDMEKPTPMDRLLCGDVGFGKTEVALRAAFKCMLDGKQCAILVPTTVLAWQHYQTALKRFQHFPIKVELLSRFRKPREQAAILRELKRGTIDLIIGTHRLVQKDVEFKDLGLAVIDEEQRFGVAHKERFKEAFKGVDMLTLSATPIPRTLNMALSGIRDMSVIDEPPMDRHPVQTYVIEHEPGVIAQAISKELRRGGQVYYIHNRVETILRTVSQLQQLLPEARIAVGHGQMGEAELSEIWRQVVEHEVDILVCTTIIETGVDVPNVNTLIIEDADRLGLSQLYQLRGRVGRSNRRAFAYFTFRRGKLLSETAQKRLEAIKEFTQFGSGFHIAMRDLEIRGAGSILSGQQHGHMEAVGYDMYLRLLNEAVAEMKGEELPRSAEDCLVDIAVNAYIPEDYIENSVQRIDIYRKIASVVTPEDSSDVLDELIDRFGEPPKAVTGLLDVALTRNNAAAIGIKEIRQAGDTLQFFIGSLGERQLRALLERYRARVKFSDGARPSFSVALDKKDRKAKAVDLMKEVIGLMQAAQETPA